MADHFIPLRRSELVQLLADDPDLIPDDADLFRQFARLIVATCRCEYTLLLEKLKASYTPFDADSDVRPLTKFNEEERQQRLIDLLADFAWLMERANYQHLNRDDITPILHTRSEWGLMVDVDFHIFERLAIFTRGDTVERRPLRKLRRFLKQEEVDVPVWQRLVMIMKLRKHPRLSRRIDTERVYLQLFKNIPKLDINMLLPGARVRMTRFDRSKVGFPMISGLGMALYNIAQDFATLAMQLASHPSLLMWGLATGGVTYGTKSWFSYLTTRQRYNLNLTQVLYFQNLDTNAGVLMHVLEEAQEQECREVLLAYFFLWRLAGSDGWTAETLRQCIEEELNKRVELTVHLEVQDALGKLKRLHLVEQSGDRYRAAPIRQVIEVLHTLWNGYMKTKPPDRWSAIMQKNNHVLDYSI
jgi:hypothetical protein